MNSGRCTTAICHIEADRAYAQKMCERISSYKIYSVLTSEGRSLPEVRCCEIRTTGAILDEKPEFMQADYLILLCSKGFSEQDHMYFDYDLRTYMEQKWSEGVDPASRIIPVVLSDKTDADEEHFCPTALTSMGADRPAPILRNRLKNDQEMILQVVCRLLGIDASTLYKRERSTKRIAGIAAALLTMLIIGIGLLCIRTFVEFKSHYLDFTMQFGLPVGIHPLSKSERESTYSHYVITKKNGKVISLEYVDSYGRRIDHERSDVRVGNRPAAYFFEYDDAGLRAVTFEDRFGKPYFVMEYVTPNLVQLKNAYNTDELHYIGRAFTYYPGGLLGKTSLWHQTSTSAFALTYSPEGYLSGAMFLKDASGVKSFDADIYGVVYLRDEKGRIVDETYVDALGRKCENVSETMTNRYVYDDEDRCTEILNLDMNGILSCDFSGRIHVVMEYDSNHNLISYSNMTGDGTINTLYKYEVDDRGNRVRRDFYNWQKNQSILVSSDLYTYDQRGFLVEETLLDEQGTPVNDKYYSYCTTCYIRDDMGNILEEYYRHTNGDLAYNFAGYGRVIRTYNRFGQVTSITYWDAEGEEQVLTENGYSREVTTYDERGRVTSYCYYDPAGNPAAVSGGVYQGYHKMSFSYEDVHGKKVTEYFGIDGNKVNVCVSSGKELQEQYATITEIAQDGEIILTEQVRLDGSIYYRAELEISSEGGYRKSVLTHINDAGLMDVKQEIRYRPNGVPLSVCIYSFKKAETPASISITTYFETGMTSGVLFVNCDSNGEPKNGMRTLYDQNGDVMQQFAVEYDSLEDIELEAWLNGIRA